MAHFAKLDENNVVIEVIVTDNNAPNEGLDWLQERLGGTWVQTSYNTYGGVHLSEGEPFRKNFAGIGFSYDEEKDAFIPPKPYDSWVIDEETCLWEAPIPYPTDEKSYEWNESIVNWVEVQGE